jgi:hypothetical protein
MDGKALCPHQTLTLYTSYNEWTHTRNSTRSERKRTECVQHHKLVYTCEILGSDEGDYEYYSHLEYCTV